MTPCCRSIPSAHAAVADRLLAAMRPDQPVDDDVALVIPTSGSTGEPKGAQLTHAALEASARATHARIGLEPDDRWLSCLPWQHIGGIQVMLRARLLGIPLTVHERFDVDAGRRRRRDADLAGADPAACGCSTRASTCAGSGSILLGGAAAPPRCWTARRDGRCRRSSRRTA